MSPNRPSFADAVIRLNSRNLNQLLEVSCLLSSAEYFLGLQSPLFPLLNNEKCRLLSEVIVAGTAAAYKSTALTRDDLAYALNGAGEALNDPRLEGELQAAGTEEEKLYAAQKFFARMANIQIRQQDIRASATVARLVALLWVIPADHIDEFPQVSRGAAQQLVAEIPRVLGGDLRDLAGVYMFVSAWHNRVGHIAQGLLPAHSSGSTRVQRQAELLYTLFDSLPNVREYLSFSYSTLAGLLPSVELPEQGFSAFVAHFARMIRDIRAEGGKEAYKIGPIGWRLSPLERFPVVDLGVEGKGPRRFIVPNVRTFMRSFPDVLHFTLQERLGEPYNEVRGMAQEVYLRLLVRNRLPDCIVIPEIAYRLPGGERKGPDCTIVEQRSRRLILVETKARRVLVETRFTMAEGIFDANFGQVYDLLLRLRSKVEHLYAGLPEYAPFQEHINSTKGEPPICVAVVGEAVYMMNEIIRYRARSDNNHPLRGYPWVYCIMPLETFEFAVEIAAAEGITLAQVLEEFWEDGATLDPSGRMSDSLRNRMVGKEPVFARSFLARADILASQGR